MAGSSKPNVSKLGREASYQIIGDMSWSTSSIYGLFDGIVANEWNTVRVADFYSPTDNVIVKINLY